MNRTVKGWNAHDNDLFPLNGQETLRVENLYEEEDWAIERPVPSAYEAQAFWIMHKCGDPEAARSISVSRC